MELVAGAALLGVALYFPTTNTGRVYLGALVVVFFVCLLLFRKWPPSDLEHSPTRLAQTSRCEVCGFMERPERSQTSQNSAVCASQRNPHVRQQSEKEEAEEIGSQE